MLSIFLGLAAAALYTLPPYQVLTRALSARHTADPTPPRHLCTKTEMHKDVPANPNKALYTEIMLIALQLKGAIWDAGMKYLSFGKQ